MYAQVPDILNALESVLKDFKANAIIEVTFRVAGTWLRELGSPPSVRLSVLPLSLLCSRLKMAINNPIGGKILSKTRISRTPPQYD